MKIFEITNRKATQYMAENMPLLKKIALAGGCLQQNVDDLLMDVYISIAHHEQNGEGFDPDKAPSVEQYVGGMIKGYARHFKYSKAEYHVGGADANAVWVYSASVSGDEEDEMTATQRAMLTAANEVDEIAEVEDNIDLTQNIKSILSNILAKDETQVVLNMLVHSKEMSKMAGSQLIMAEVKKAMAVFNSEEIEEIMACTRYASEIGAEKMQSIIDEITAEQTAEELAIVMEEIYDMDFKGDFAKMLRQHNSWDELTAEEVSKCESKGIARRMQEAFSFNRKQMLAAL